MYNNIDNDSLQKLSPTNPTISIDTDSKIENHIREILKLLSVTNPEVLQETPRRFREFLQERTSSNREPLDRNVMKSFEMESSGMVVLKDIEINSICEHHLVPFFGTAAIGYIPKGQVLGLSKIVRLVNYCCKKENLQERLTKEIVETLSSAVENEGICVVVRCKHFCMIMNEEVRSKSDTITVVKTGKFKEDNKVYEEFQMHIK